MVLIARRGVSRFLFCRVIAAVWKTYPLRFRSNADPGSMNECLLVSGCYLKYRAREMSGVSLLLLQETEPYLQDSGGSRTQPIAASSASRSGIPPSRLRELLWESLSRAFQTRQVLPCSGMPYRMSKC